MSHFFEDVGNIITSPFREIGGLISGNPKYNSIGDLWNQSVGPSNPLDDVLQNEGLNKAARITSLPSWDALGKPGQAFSDFVNTQNSVLPADWRPYAEPLEAVGLSLFNPFAGAALQTAYQGGEEQANNKGFDWGDLGKNAAINFGTASIAQGAKSLLSGADAANAARAPFSVSGALNAADTANIGNALNPVANAGSALAGFGSTTAGALASNSANALQGIGAAIPSISSAVDGFNPNLVGSSQSITPQANALQSSGIGDAAYKAGINTGKTVINNAITSTLSPQGNQPISGALDSFANPIASTPSGSGMQWGDVLNAFGGNEINNPNPNGPRIDDDAFNAMVNRLAANSYLQENQARDTAIPAGQYQASQNTPYANRLDEINRGSTQTYADLLDQVNNANRYYGVIDSTPGLTTDQLDTYLNDPSSIDQVNNADKFNSILNNNPGLTADQLNSYLANPSSGVLGNFTVPSNEAGDFAGLTAPSYPNSFFQPGTVVPVPADSSVFAGLRSLGPQNNSLLH